MVLSCVPISRRLCLFPVHPMLLLKLLLLTLVAVQADPLFRQECPCHRGWFACSRSISALSTAARNQGNSDNGPKWGPTETDCLCIPISHRCNGENECFEEEDERNCSFGNCRRDQFQCDRSGECIGGDFVCDGYPDCKDGSDEACRTKIACGEGLVRCANGNCIQDRWICDGDNDCGDLSDEMNCTRDALCGQDQFRCNDGSCIDTAWRCDERHDCNDGSDEFGCVPKHVNCSKGEVSCYESSQCISENARCDGKLDCPHGTDEEHCPAKQDCFRCGDNCIDWRWVCDREWDCPDGSDESVACHDYGTPKMECLLPLGESYQCQSGDCIDLKHRCDGEIDCLHGDDELGCRLECPEDHFRCSELGEADAYDPHSCHPVERLCNKLADCPNGEDEAKCPPKLECTSRAGCSHRCVQEESGYKCLCDSGFRLAPNSNTTCVDIDECNEEPPICEQQCQNSVGSFACSCEEGYKLRNDRYTCKASGPAPYLIFANPTEIRKISVDSARYEVVVTDLHNAVALEYHLQENLLFWSDIGVQAVMRASLEGEQIRSVLLGGLKDPTGLALDWIHNLLFVVDAGSKRIDVCSLTGTYRKSVVWRGLDKPRGIAVHPGLGKIYWTDYGDKTGISSAWEDGTDITALVTKDIFRPNGLTIDYATERLFWAGASPCVIASVKLDGTGRRKVVDCRAHHPFAMTVFESRFFWTEWASQSIYSVSRFGRRVPSVLHKDLPLPMDIHVVHPLRQPAYPDRCGPRKGGCSDLCLPWKTTYRCACRYGYALLTDMKTCERTTDNFLLVGADQSIYYLPLSDGEINFALPAWGMNKTSAMDYHPGREIVVWADANLRSISSIYRNGTDMRVVVENLGSVTGVAADWITDKIYWIDSERKVLEVSEMNGSNRGLVIWEGLVSPGDLTASPLDALLIWSDTGSSVLETCDMDGSSRQTIVRGANNARGLTVASWKNKRTLFWIDRVQNSIHCSYLDGSERRVLLGGPNDVLSRPYALEVLNGRLYWSDLGDNVIKTVDLKDHGSGRTRGSTTSRIETLDFTSGNNEVVESLRGSSKEGIDRKPSGVNPCRGGKQSCSHLCLLTSKTPYRPNRERPLQAKCACPTGWDLGPDGFTCQDWTHRDALVVANRTDIRLVPLGLPYATDVVLPIECAMKNVIAVDVDVATGDVYWTDTAFRHIGRADPKTGQCWLVVYRDLGTIQDLAVDHVGRKIFWVDYTRLAIEVANLDGTFRKVLFFENIDKPSSVTAIYSLGYIVWASSGDAPRIERGGMDGTDREVLVSRDLVTPVGVAYDATTRRVVWADSKLRRVEACSVRDGGGRTVLLEEAMAGAPHAVAPHGDWLFWADWDANAVQEVRLGADGTAPVQGQRVVANLSRAIDLAVSPATKPAEIESACGLNNGGCSHLCLKSPIPSSYWLTGTLLPGDTLKFSCACPTGLSLMADEKTCTTMSEESLIFAAQSLIGKISLDDLGLFWPVTLPLNPIKTVTSIEFDWASKALFLADAFLGGIYATNLTETSNAAMRTLVKDDVKRPDSLAIEWIAKNLYFSDAGKKVIEVIRLDGSDRKIVIPAGLSEPRSLAVHPDRGYLFWTDVAEPVKIERSYLDGSGRRIIIKRDIQWPNGLVIDYEENFLYWADAHLNRIESSDFRGRRRRIVIGSAASPYGLALLGNNLYWTEFERRSIETARKNDGRGRKVIGVGWHELMEIRAVAESRQKNFWNPCVVENGRCSHLCLYRPIRYSCGCPDRPIRGGRPCSEQPSERVPHGPEPWFETEDPILPPEAEENATSTALPGDASLRPREMSRSGRWLIYGSQIGIGLMVVMLCVCGVVWQKRKRSTQGSGLVREDTTGGSSMMASRAFLSFSNPTYSSTQLESSTDSRQFLARSVRFNKSDDHIVSVTLPCINPSISSSGGGTDAEGANLLNPAACDCSSPPSSTGSSNQVPPPRPPRSPAMAAGVHIHVRKLP